MTQFAVTGQFRQCPTCHAPALSPTPPGWTIELIKEGPPAGPVESFLTFHAEQCNAPDANPRPGRAVRVPASYLADLSLTPGPPARSLPSGPGTVYVGPAADRTARPCPDLADFREVGRAEVEGMAVGWALVDIGAGSMVQLVDGGTPGARWIKPTVTFNADSTATPAPDSSPVRVGRCTDHDGIHVEGTFNADGDDPCTAFAEITDFVHRVSENGNAFGGYDCTCGEPWLDTLGGCAAGGSRP